MNSDLLHVDIMFPIYILGNCYWTVLLILDIHRRLLHYGTAHTLSQRNRQWIHKGGTIVSSVLLKSIRCRHYQGGPFKMPKMMLWPTKKVSRSAQFTGLYYLGPLYVKSKVAKQKVWVALFTCIVVGTIHLEIKMIFVC